jgi:hypothetical protein
LRFAAAQVFAQFRREPFFAGHFRGRAFIHGQRFADKAAHHQPPLDIAGERDNSARLIRRCCSSVVERTLGKGEVGSSILPSSTIFQCFSAPVLPQYGMGTENRVVFSAI